MRQSHHGSSAMGHRIIFLAAVLFVAAVSFALNARAGARIDLEYPGWALSLDRQASIHEEKQESRTLSLRFSGAGLASQTGWRLPLRDSAFLSLEATFTTPQLNPAHPALARPSFQAGIGVGFEF